MKKFKIKNRVIWVDRNKCMTYKAMYLAISLIHFVKLYSKVDYRGCKCDALEVIHLFLHVLWQS